MKEIQFPDGISRYVHPEQKQAFGAQRMPDGGPDFGSLPFRRKFNPVLSLKKKVDVMFFLSFICGFVQYCLLRVFRMFRTERKRVWENLVHVWRSAARISAERERFLRFSQTRCPAVFAGMSRWTPCRNTLEEDSEIPPGKFPEFFFLSTSEKRFLSGISAFYG